MKTPKSVKLNAQSQIFMAKTNQRSGMAMEVDINYLSNNVIVDGKVRETFPDYDDDEPKQGKKPEPAKEKGLTFWGKVVVGVAVVAAVALVCLAAPEIIAGAAFVSRAFQTAATAVKILAIIGGTVAFVNDVGTQYATNDGFDKFSLKELGVATLSGAISGAFAAIPLARGPEAAINGVIGGVQSAANGGGFTDTILAIGFSVGAGWVGGAWYKPGLCLSIETYKAEAKAAASTGFKAGAVSSWISTGINSFRKWIEGDKTEDKEILC